MAVEYENVSPQRFVNNKINGEIGKLVGWVTVGYSTEAEVIYNGGSVPVSEPPSDIEFVQPNKQDVSS